MKGTRDTKILMPEWSSKMLLNCSHRRCSTTCCSILPNRAIMMRRTSKTMRAAVENAKVDAIVVSTIETQFSDGNGLLDKLSDLNAW